MKAILIINGVDFSPWLLSGGLQQTEVPRLARSVVTLDGVSHQQSVVKRGITASMVEMRDTTWYRLADALKTRPAVVRYIDDRYGDTTRLFYVSNPTASAKTVRGGHTYFQGGSFTLEEK